MQFAPTLFCHFIIDGAAPSSLLSLKILLAITASSAVKRRGRLPEYGGRSDIGRDSKLFRPRYVLSISSCASAWPGYVGNGPTPSARTSLCCQWKDDTSSPSCHVLSSSSPSPSDASVSDLALDPPCCSWQAKYQSEKHFHAKRKLSHIYFLCNKGVHPYSLSVQYTNANIHQSK